MKARAGGARVAPNAKNGSVLILSQNVALAEALVASLPSTPVRVIALDSALRLDVYASEPTMAILVAFDFATVAAGIRMLQRRWRRVRILVVGLENDEESILRTMALGALGIVTRHESLDELRVAVQEVMSDRFHLPQELMRPLFDRLVSVERGPGSLAQQTPLTRLSAREVDILACLARGETNKDIAERLHVEVQTVKNHVSHILRKLGVHSRFDAARVGGSHTPGEE